MLDSYRKLSQGHCQPLSFSQESLGSVSGQAQESMGSFVEAAKDLAQEVRGLPISTPGQESVGAGAWLGEGTG